MATVQEILDKINASKSNNVNNNSFIDLMRQISGNPEDATAPVNDTNSIYGHIVQMYTTLYDGGIDYAILADEVDMLQEVYDNLIAINSVHVDKTKLDSLYADKLTLDSLYADKDKLDQLFADKAIIDRVYRSIDNIDRVHASIDKLDAVYADILNIDTVSNNLANIDIVAESDDNITIVADNVTDVNTVADNMIILNEIYNNRVEIYAADDNAVIAITKASEASVSATASASSASAAAASAGISTTKANEASASAAAALVSRNDVSVMKLAVETIYDTFDDRFLGTKTTNPVLDNDGNTLIDGAMYFNTTDNAMKVYDAVTTTWYSIPQIYLSGLLDVELTSITTGDILVWNGTKWSNTANPKVDSIQLNGGSGTEGTISWNTTEQTLDITQDGTTLQVGQELQYIVRNVSGNTIANGTFVGFAGVTSGANRIIASPFDTSTMTAIKLIGFATEDIANGVNGRVTNFGYIRGLDTRGTAVTGMSVGNEDWSYGDVLYVHPTVAGKLTKVAPTSGIKAPVATVTNRHQIAGELFVNVIAIDQLKVDHGEAAYNRTTNIDNTMDATKNVLSATKLATARTINGVSFDGSANITVSDSTAVKLTGNQTIAGVKTFTSSPIVPVPTTGTQVANKVYVDGKYSGFKNYIINGNFDIWQRGTSHTTNSTINYGSADRWRSVNLDTTNLIITRQEVSGVVPFQAKYFIRQTVPLNTTTGTVLDQFIEGLRQFSNKVITLSMWVNGTAGKKICIGLEAFYGTGGSPSINESILGSVYTLSGGWEKISITRILPDFINGKTYGTNGNDALRVAILTQSGSIGLTPEIFFQSGTFDIAQVQLEEGSVATPFENRPYGLELMLCQRYYEIGQVDEFYNFSGALNNIGTGTKYKNTKRVTPTVVLTYGFLDQNRIDGFSMYGTVGPGLWLTNVAFSASAEI